jgi:hypothetical protein
MGSMFFQQLTLFAEKESNLFYLTKNINALDATYLGTEVRVPGPNPFVVKEEDLTVDTEKQIYSGMPTFLASIVGVEENSPYFYADFNNDNTIVWANNCTQNVEDTTFQDSCTASPTHLMTSFSPTASTPYQGSY